MSQLRTSHRRAPFCMRSHATLSVWTAAASHAHARTSHAHTAAAVLVGERLHIAAVPLARGGAACYMVAEAREGAAEAAAALLCRLLVARVLHDMLYLVLCCDVGGAREAENRREDPQLAEGWSILVSRANLADSSGFSEAA